MVHKLLQLYPICFITANLFTVIHNFFNTREETTFFKAGIMKKQILIVVCLIVGLYGARQFFLTNPKRMAQQLLAQAHITINGSNPWDMTVHNDLLYARALTKGSLGLGEAYMDGWWDCPALDQFFYRISRADLYKHIPKNVESWFAYLKASIMNLQSPSRAFQVGERHYDLGNDLFKAMLDKYMFYSCAYWKDAQTLDQAQQDKCELICKKLYLKPGMKLLDIGCGWGGLALYAAKHYGVNVVGVTISKEQAEYARNLTRNLPVDIRLQDYRSLHEPFDRIVSVGMFEHVGYQNYKTFIKIAQKLLKDDGLMLLHTIGSNESQAHGDPWLTKYIFPNGMLPSIEQIAQASQGILVMEDWHNFGTDYDKTLMAWAKNFDFYWPELQPIYGNRFYRMWKYYLLSCAGLFRARTIQLWQIVFSKGIIDDYISVR